MTEVKPDLTVITTHLNADFDALASMLAANLLYPDAVAVFPGSQEKGLRDFFVQSASYLINLQRIKHVDLNRISRLVLVDTRQKTRIGRFAKLIQDSRPVEIHIYDHHPPSADDVRGDLEHISEVGACTSLMIPLLLERGIEIKPDQATLLALGIYEDTGSFTFASTTPSDLAACRELLLRGANLNTVASLIVRQLDAAQVGLLNDLLQHLERLRIGGREVAIASCSADSYSPDFAVVAHKLVEMENLPVLFALARMEERVHLVARSNVDDIDVGRIAAAFGGGGHPWAASATIRHLTLIEIRQKLILLLESQVSLRSTAREIMSFPVLWVSPDAPLSEAENLLTRYSVNVLLVMDEDNPVGLISRQVVEKGIYLGLDDQPVSEYMNRDFVTIPPSANLNEIQERIVGQRQRILPVLDHGRVVGVVTRSDLLNILMDEPPIPDSLYDSRQARNYIRKKSILSLMTERLPKDLLELLKEMGNFGDELGYNVYLVGGFVRDLVLRRQNLDVDLVIEGDGIEFARTFARKAEARVRDHAKFGTAVIIFENGYKIDVATARLEYYEKPASLPIVETSSLKLDLYRRDFTINTMAVKLNKNHFGMLIDYFGAQRDLKERAIRVLHSLSFVEDPTRCLRAVRFEQRFGFKIGKLTRNLITNAIRINAFKRVNPTRLFVELTHILEEPNPAPILRRMAEFGLLKAIHPGLAYDEDTDNLVYQVQTVLNWFDLLYLSDRFNRWLVYFLALTDNLRDRELQELIDILAIAPRYGELTKESRIWARRITQTLTRRPNMRPSSLFRLIEKAPLEGKLWAMARGESDDARRAFSAYFTQMTKVRPLIDGEVLKELGFKPGRVFREILEAVRDARLNGRVKTLEDEKDFVRRRFANERKG